MSPLPYRHLEWDPEQRYLVSEPSGPVRGLLVSVHGISRNAWEHLTLFRPWADRLGLLLVAPLFDRRRCQDYQRLGREGRGLRADRLLQAIVAEVVCRHRLPDRRFHLFGYSGGGQFAHRFAMAHPGQVRTLAVGAAGWYTFPDPQQRYPYGLQPCKRLPDLRFEPCHFLRIPTLVAVGSEDNRPDPELNTRPRIVAQQGGSRLERGERWLAAMQAMARRHGFDTSYRFEIIPGAGHDFRCCMERGMGAVAAAFIARHLARAISATPELEVACR